MIQRFSSKSKIFTVKPSNDGCDFSWQASFDLSSFKYMAVLDFFTSHSWPSDGKKLCHLSSNLTYSSECNQNGHIYTWMKKPSSHQKGLISCFYTEKMNYFRVSCA